VLLVRAEGEGIDEIPFVRERENAILDVGLKARAHVLRMAEEGSQGPSRRGLQEHLLPTKAPVTSA
jgi:hypothetical protein